MLARVPVGDFLLGVAILGLTTGSAALFAVRVVRRFIPELTGTARALAFALVGLLGFIAIHLVPGALGLLGKFSVVACALLLAAAAVLLSPREKEPEPAFMTGPPSGRLSWSLAGAGAGLLALYVFAHGIDHGGVATQHVDMTTFHFPNVVRWLQTGSFWQIDDFVPHRAFGSYPNTSDVVVLGAFLPFDNDFLARFVNYPALIVAGLAVYSLGRELGAPAAPSALFATTLLATPVVTLIALEGLADTLMLAGFAAGLLFLLRHRRTGAPSDLALAGVGLGISFGTKWYALPAVFIVVAGWTIVAAIDRQALRAVVARTVALSGIVVAVGGFWLLRNLVELGNPVFPVEVGVGGLTVFDAPPDVVRERTGFSLVDYLGEPAVWRHQLWPAFLAIMGWASVLLWALLPTAAVWAVLRIRRSREQGSEPRSILWCAAIAVAIGLAYLFTPYTAQGELGDPLLASANSRYVVPALVICAALAAWLTGQAGRGRVGIELLALLGVLDALRRDPDVAAAAVAAAALLLAAVGGAIVAARWLPRGDTWARSRPLRGAAVAVVALVVVLGLYAQQHRFNDGRYAEAAETDRWVSAHAPSGQRVGVAGDGFVVYPMFGPRFENEVEYVGPVIDGMLRTYTDRAGFQTALTRGRYDLVLLQDFGYMDPRLPDRQEAWIRELGYREVARGRQDSVGEQYVRLYRSPLASRGR